MSDTTIDNIFKNLVAVYDEAGKLGEIPTKVGFRIIGIPEAKSALYELMLEIIGEDEPRKNYAYGNVCEAAWQQANWTRQEQRTKLKELFK